MRVTLADCREDDVPSLLAFWANVYGPDYVLCRDQALFDWQFASSPFGDGRHCIKIARVDGEVAGCLGFMPVPVGLRGTVVAGAWLANWMVDPAHRRLGLGPLMLRELTREVDVIVNVGISPEARDVLTRLRWTDFGELARHVAVLDPDAVRLLTGDDAGEWPALAPGDERGHGDALAVRRVPSFDDEAGSLWDGMWDGRVAGVRRTAALLNWRYAAHPVFEYRLLEARRRDRLEGIAVYRVEAVRDIPVRIARILELVGDDAAVSRLVRGILDDARAEGAAAVDFFCSSRRAAPALAGQGFLAADRAPASLMPWLFQPLDGRRTGIAFMAYPGSRSATLDAQDWYVTKGDADQDRPN